MGTVLARTVPSFFGLPSWHSQLFVATACQDSPHRLGSRHSQPQTGYPLIAWGEHSELPLSTLKYPNRICDGASRWIAAFWLHGAVWCSGAQDQEHGVQHGPHYRCSFRCYRHSQWISTCPAKGVISYCARTCRPRFTGCYSRPLKAPGGRRKSLGPRTKWWPPAARQHSESDTEPR